MAETRDCVVPAQPKARPAGRQGGRPLRAGPRELERAGRPGGPDDMQFGAHARSEGLIVGTNNMKEFIRMPGVRVENRV
ncbi:hypothetical protein QBD01_005074 [Ochrobactrum sp. 19YEA23]|nr:hypothetical protein [Ochrobactrum sp. 19YEA23]